MTDPAALFDTDFARRAPSLASRPEIESDTGFLIAMFAACSPLAAVLPPPMMEMQARTQLASHNASHPGAMRRIVEMDGRPIGRIMVDWDHRGVSHGVDIAVMPDARESMAGLHMLRSWLAVADVLQRTCTLEVFADNPAQRIYRHLGFVPAPGDNMAYVNMIRAARD